MKTNKCLVLFLNLFRSKKNKSKEVLTFAELMIRVDEAEEVEQLSEVVDYFEKFQTWYSIPQQRFAKEHFLEKITFLQEKYLNEYKQVIQKQ